MKIINKEWDALTFDDVLLCPSYSNIESRLDISLETMFSRNVRLKIPVVAANMDTVCETEMAQAMADIGGIGVIHRFLTIEQQTQMVNDVQGQVAAAVGVDREAVNRACALVEAGVDALVIDIAHGYSDSCLRTLKALKKFCPNIDVVAGNVATADAAQLLVSRGADAVKVGIGPGGFCSTRIVAGTGMPQLTAIDVCSSAAHGFPHSHTPVIADGGIRNSGDAAKALAAGASTIMLGSLLSGTDEAPGVILEDTEGKYKLGRGMASFEAMAARDDKTGTTTSTDGRAPEGVQKRMDYKGSMFDVIDPFLAGIRSAMSYQGAHDIPTLWEKAKFVRTTANAVQENRPHA